MSFKILASIRYFEVEDLDIINTPIFSITTHPTEKAKVLDGSFKQYAGLRDIMSYDKNALAYVVHDSTTDDDAFQQRMTTEMSELAAQIETLLLFLWFVKDNSTSLEQVYGQFTIAKNINWWTGRNIFSKCNGRFGNTVFNKDELSEAIDLLLKYTQHSLECDLEKKIDKSMVHSRSDSGEFRPGVNPYKIENRIERAMSFLSTARAAPHLPQKITHYMSILECLFSTEGTEIIHKVSERTAFYLGNDKAHRLEVFKTVKIAYGVRSKFVHGDSSNKTHDELRIIANDVDIIIRRVLKKIILQDFKMFLQKDLNAYFNDLIF